MIPARLAFAVEKLRQIRPEPEPVDEVPSPFVRAAAAVADELAAAGLEGRLTRLAAPFASLAEPGGAFDRARSAASELLKAPDNELYLPDDSQRYVSRRRVPYLDANGFWDGSFVGKVTYGNYLPTIRNRLANADRVRWHLSAALEDAESILRLQLSEPRRDVFRQWRQELWTASVGVSREHQLGAFLLAECRQAMSGDAGGPARSKAIAERLNEDPVRFLSAAQDAAEYLALFAAGERPGGEHTQEKDSGSWFHPAGEEPPPQYKHGPIGGNQKTLADAICPLFDKKGDTRHLQRLALEGVIWVVKYSGQTYQAFFQDQKVYAEANARQINGRAKRLEGRKQQKEASNAQKAAK
jgi:hypothetical protein